MEKSDQILEKLLDDTLNKKISWLSRTVFRDSEDLHFDNPDFLFDESYSYYFSATNESMTNGGTFYLSTFKKNGSKRIVLEFVKGLLTEESKVALISKDQEKLFELKALIEYKEPDSTTEDILDRFLNDKN